MLIAMVRIFFEKDFLLVFMKLDILTKKKRNRFVAIHVIIEIARFSYEHKTQLSNKYRW